jgi:cellulose synthase/poly-beta-1,6-N-acetylglucosamine synthase-like glycosyltransferase
LRYKNSKENVSALLPIPENKPNSDLPFVTIQLPIFNEKYVVKRLIDNIVSIDYPKERMEIQVLDDSTDDTNDIAQKSIEKYRKEGFRIHHITRDDRQGFKAGALKEATKIANGEFIAIFDADFLPEPTFLRKVLPYFNDPKVGVVQARWEHINEEYSLLTRLQAFQLNVHFTVEQKGRDVSDYLLQFNGTAGIWRKEAIADSGGWEADTLTEDLDLSYRAQLKGWKIIFRDDIGAPAELPAEINGLKSQQYRWMKGGAETAKKMLPKIWKSPLGFWRKFHATMHLLSSSVFLFVFIIGVFSVPILFYIIPLGINTKLLGVFLISLLCIMMVYFYANAALANPDEPKWRTWFKMILLFPIFLAVSMGLSLHNSVAVIQGFRGKKSSFIRTPKFDIKGFADSLNKKSNYVNTKFSWITVIEGLLAIYFFLGIIAGWLLENNTFILFHLLLVVGYSIVFFYSIKHTNIEK